MGGGLTIKWEEEYEWLTMSEEEIVDDEGGRWFDDEAERKG